MIIVYLFNCDTVALHLAFLKNLPVSTCLKNHINTLSHHDFSCCHGITSSMKNTGATPDLPWLPSLQHCLQPFCWLVWSDSHYFLRNHTISSMHNLLHDSHHHRKKGRLEKSACKLIFSVIMTRLIHLQKSITDATSNSCVFLGVLLNRFW